MSSFGIASATGSEPLGQRVQRTGARVTSWLVLLAMFTCTFAVPARSDGRMLKQTGPGEVLFVGRSFGVPVASGRFERFECRVAVDLERPDRSRVAVRIVAGSLRTLFGFADGFVKGKDVLNVSAYPHLSFVSQSVRQIDGNHYWIEGQLRIKAVSRTVELRVTIDGDLDTLTEGQSLPFTATTSVSRSEFGIGPGIPLLDDRLEIAVRGNLS